MKIPVFAFTILISLTLLHSTPFINALKPKSLTPNTYLETDDKQRLLNLFKLESPFESFDDLNRIYYSLLGTSILTNGNINTFVKDTERNQICQLVKKYLSQEQLTIDNVYFATSINKLINCQATTTTKLSAFINSLLKEDSKVVQLHRAALSLLNFGQKLDSNKISKLLLAALKKDETLESVGLAFQLGAHLTDAQNLNPLVEKIGDIIIQADEVDGRNLQFEGGLGITANIIYGIYTLAAASNKPTGLTNDQALKFTNYFLNRKTVQTVKSAADLLRVLELLVNNKYHIPVCVTLYRSTAVSHKNPVITVKVTNVLGKSLGPNTKVNIDSPVTGKKALSPVTGDGTLFASEIDKQAKRGVYSLSVDIMKGEDKRYIGNTNAQLQVNVMTEVKLENVEFSVTDTDQSSSSSKSIPLTYPKQFTNEINADYHQKLLLKFTLKDAMNSEILSAHQTFVLFKNVETKQEIIFVAEPEKSSVAQSPYKFDLNLNNKGKDFGHKSGVYEISLIVGDAVILNTINWKLGTVKLTFSPTASNADTQVHKAPWMIVDYKPKPEIQHIFREQDKRPPAVVSNTFSVLVCLPFLLLIILWIRLGVNFKNLPLCLSLPIFHIGLGSIFGLFVCFWLELNMFTTLKYLLGIGIITFLSGHNLLSRLARKE